MSTTLFATMGILAEKKKKEKENVAMAAWRRCVLGFFAFNTFESMASGDFTITRNTELPRRKKDDPTET